MIQDDATYRADGDICVTGDDWSELFVAEPPKLDSAEAVFVTRAMLVAGMLVGITGESDATPSMEQLDRAADLIMRAGRAHRIAMERVVDAIKQHRAEREVTT